MKPTTCTVSAVVSMPLATHNIPHDREGVDSFLGEEEAGALILIHGPPATCLYTSFMAMNCAVFEGGYIRDGLAVFSMDRNSGTESSKQVWVWSTVDHFG